MLQCLVCGGAALSVYFDDAEDSIDVTAIGSSRTILSPGKIMRCKTCGFAFRQNRFDELQIADLYRKMDTKVYQAEFNGRIRTAENHLRIVTRHLPSNTSPGAILDVGCASGLFLDKALDAGWTVVGLEPSEVLYRQAVERIGNRGTVLPFMLEEADFNGKLFDAITLWDVLEHVVDPVNFLRRIHEHLKPDGCLFLNVPDLDSIEARLLGRRWPLLLPEHLNYFTRSSIRLCAEKCQFKLIRFGRRRSYFSLQYVFYRLSQHNFPAANFLHRLSKSWIGKIVIPVSLGETWAVLQRQ